MTRASAGRGTCPVHKERTPRQEQEGNQRNEGPKLPKFGSLFFSVNVARFIDVLNVAFME